MFLCEGSTEIASLIEIYVDGEYKYESFGEPKIIIDVGAHNGDSAIYFSCKYPDSVVYAVEASPKNFESLEKNVSGIKNIVPIFGAVGDRDGVINFFETSSSLGSGLKKRSQSDVEVEVPCFTLNTLLNEQGLKKVDLIKVDIEGSEENLFKESKPENYADSYIIEIHNDLMSISEDDFVNYFNHFSIDFMDTGSGNSQRKILVAKMR